MGAFKIFLSIIVILFFSFFIVLLFISSQTDDKYVHILKDSIVNNIDNVDNKFVGFQGEISFVKKEVLSFNNDKVLFYEQKFQEYVCKKDSNGKKKCNWETKDTKSDFSSFKVLKGSKEILVSPKNKNDFVPHIETIIPTGEKKRILENKVFATGNIFVWGKLEGDNLVVYDELGIDRNSILITDDSEKTLIGLVKSSLIMQTGVGLLCVFMFIILYSIGISSKERSYIGTNYESNSVLNNQGFNNMNN